mgnify:FL=1
MTSEGDWDETLENDIPRLAALLRETGAEEIEVGCGDRTIRMRRSMVEGMDITNAESGEEQTVSPSVGHTTITAEQVGVFRATAEPGSLPLAKAGDSVDEGQAIGFVDVLGVVHEVCAPIAGTLTQFLINDGELVEYGQDIAELNPIATSV